MKLIVFKNLGGVVGLKYVDENNKLLSGPIFFDGLSIDKKLVGELFADEKQLNFMVYDPVIKTKPRPEIVCLCGSTRFKKEFEEQNKLFTREGYIVMSVGEYGHADGTNKEIETKGIKKKLDKLHFSKIDLADWIFVINVDGYIGRSTKNEIEYAKGLGKSIRYLEAKASWHYKNGHRPKEESNV